MARLNTYTRTSQPSDSDVFVIDSTTGSAGTRTVLWSSIKALFAAAKHSHAASDIASGTLAVDRLPTIPLSKGGTGATSDATARTALGVQNPPTAPVVLTDQNLNSYNTEEQCGYYYAGGGNTVSNKPSGVQYFGMWMMHTASGVFTQILYDNSGKIWTRSYSTANSEWSTWTALVRTTDTIAKAASATNATNATNATKATQDSAGQTINTTYVKSVTASGRTVTVTKGNGTTSTFTTQDTTYVKSVTASGRTVTVTKGNGTTSTFTTQDTTYSAATQSTAGLMSAADKKKLDGLSGDYGSAIGVATSSKDGLMSKTDKAKLDKFPLDGMTRISEATIDGMF